VVVAGLKGEIETAMKKLVLECTAQLVHDTPRDTGWARNNWIPEIGQAHEETEGTPQSVSSAGQEAGIAKVASSYRLEDGEVHITNNVPYIELLNDGSSKQAPPGFVEISILEAVRRISS